MTFKWTKNMAVDNGLIDGDHQALIAIANRLSELSHPNQEADEIQSVIRELYDYVSFHFTREEAFMRRILYPHKNEHIEKHRLILSEMNRQLTSSHHLGEVLISFQNLMQKWIMEHIMEEDMQIKAYLSRDAR
jgi:hemerythrin